MTASVLMKFGDFIFGLDTAAYQTLNRNTDYNWVEMGRLSGHPVQQWMGVNAETMNLTGVIFTHYARSDVSFIAEDFNIPFSIPDLEIVRLQTRPVFPRPKPVGDKQLEILRQMAKTGTPQKLIDGRGFFYGWYCLRTIAETQSVLFNDGTPRKQEFDITLVKFGEDSPYKKPPVYGDDTNSTPKTNKPASTSTEWFSSDGPSLLDPRVPNGTGVLSEDELRDVVYETAEEMGLDINVGSSIVQGTSIITETPYRPFTYEYANGLAESLSNSSLQANHTPSLFQIYTEKSKI